MPAAREDVEHRHLQCALRHLEALLIVADSKATFILSGNGDVIEPDDGIVSIGSGGSYAIGSQYIVYQLRVTGSGNFNVDYRPLAGPPNRDLYLVE